jgi:hypothetical protein
MLFWMPVQRLQVVRHSDEWLRASISTASAKKGVKAALGGTQGLVQKMFGPAAEELGLVLRDKARVYRLMSIGELSRNEMCD